MQGSGLKIAIKNLIIGKSSIRESYPFSTYAKLFEKHHPLPFDKFCGRTKCIIPEPHFLTTSKLKSLFQKQPPEVFYKKRYS